MQVAEASDLRADGLSFTQISSFYDRALGLKGGIPGGDAHYRGPGRAARSGDELVGLFAGSVLPENENPQAGVLYLFGAVLPAWRRHGIGRRLVEGLADDVRNERGPVTLVATLSGSEAQTAAPFLQQLGFTEHAGLVRYERDLPPALGPWTEPAMRTSVYRGGDPAIDAAIIDLYRDAYRGHTAIPQLTLEGLKEQLEVPGFAYVLAFDGEALVGNATLYSREGECYVDSTVVTPSHWGAGVTTALALTTFRHGAEQGCRRIAGTADAGNRHSRALMERLGFEFTTQKRRFLRVMASRT